jgi:outer membrane protein assembly factor BamB
LHWLKLLPSEDEGRVEGPQTVATGWDRFVNVIPAGGPAMYGLQPDGNLVWTSHEGAADGTPRWAAERRVGWGWQDFLRVMPAGNGIVYALRKDGELLWYRHRGFRAGDGIATWDGPVIIERPIIFRPRSGPLDPDLRIPRPWTTFRHIVPMGDTAIYVVDGRGDMFWLRHEGARDGRPTLSGGQRVGVGWTDFQTLLTSPPGRVYAIRPNGEMLYYQHRGWATGGDVTTWNEPVTIGGGWTGHRQVFVLAPIDAMIG